jgi:aminoglycoside phosphotransferase (APT) family kinase protein
MSDEPHGFVLSAADEQLLRGAPPALALTWALRAVGADARVRAWRALVGGTSSAVHALTIEDGDGRVHELVLRRFVRSDWLADEPDLATREATALALLAGASVPAPRLVAVDPDGADAGAPAVLMTRLAGRITWSPTDVDAFLRALAEPLPRIHATAFPFGVALPAYRPYRLRIRRPPAWASRPEVWRRAVAALDAPPPTSERLFVHRDYHPGNVLWHRERLNGIVDWVNASIGSSWADVGHCRVNLVSSLGQAAADRFLDAYRAVAGRRDDYHPYWDISAAIGGLDETVDGEPSPSDERFLEAAVARL